VSTLLRLVALALAGGVLAACGDPPGEADDPMPSPTASRAPSASSTPVVDPGPAPTRTVFYVGLGPDGPDGDEAALYAYPEVENPDDHDTGTILDLLTSTPTDPDYRTLWPRGSFLGVGDPEAGESVVELASSVPQERPHGMAEREAELAVQQVVYSVVAYYDEALGVRFVGASGPMETVLGVPTDNGFVAAASPLSVLSHLSITEPAEGMVVRDAFTATGGANGFEGTVACGLDDQGGNRAWLGATIAGWQEDRLFPWELEVDLTDVTPGTYTLRCRTDDPTGGTEGAGAYEDSRTVVVEPPSTTPEPPPVGNPDPPRPVYYVGDTTYGARLFRYLEPNDSGEPDHGPALLLGHLSSQPSDPDYSTLWPAGSFRGLRELPSGEVAVELTGTGQARPDGLSADDAALARQQVAYSVGAAFGRRVSVVFVDGRGRPADLVLGFNPGGVVEAAPPLEVLSLVNLSDPAEEQVVRDRFVARGEASSFEGTVGWEVRRLDGRAVLRGSAQAGGAYLDRLSPFEQTIDVSLLQGGRYLFVAMTDDPSGDDRVYTDTRTLLIK
jgi:hypothetical protein